MRRAVVLTGRPHELAARVEQVAQRSMAPPCTCCLDPGRLVEVLHVALAVDPVTRDGMALVIYGDGMALVIYEDGE